MIGEQMYSNIALTQGSSPIRKILGKDKSSIVFSSAVVFK